MRAKKGERRILAGKKGSQKSKKKRLKKKVSDHKQTVK
jgi:hypothetical protein